jgi:hypothetical protein
VSLDLDEDYLALISENPDAEDMFEFHLSETNPHYKINWDWLSFNPGALNLLKANPIMINWDWLSTNPDPSIINDLLKPVAHEPDKINWWRLSENPGIFETDMKQYKIDITEKANMLDMLLYKN